MSILSFNAPKLPSKQGDIDWDTVSKDYYQYILSPFAPEMVALDAASLSRNLLLNYLESISPSILIGQTVLDIGCGPGNLIEFLAGRVRSLTAVDLSGGAVKVAKAKAANYPELEFDAIHSNILDLQSFGEHDLIISSNSILPKTRVEVVTLFQQVSRLLKPEGRFLAILPSFDTTLYLRSLWLDRARQQNLTDFEIEQLKQDFDKAKLVDETLLAYADDGHNLQCYHTYDSIASEMEQSGLVLEHNPSKIYYPWALCEQFDYGNFPEAEEEIWDWFVVAKRN